MSAAQGTVLLLIGSPKGLERSQSARLAKPVIGEMMASGWRCEEIHLQATMASQSSIDGLLEAVGRSDTILLSAPLYVDSLPAPVIDALRRIAEHRSAIAPAKVQRFAAIMNCGFVEPRHNDTCQFILQQFVQRARLEWVGGASVGCGGRMNRRVRKALEMMGRALADEVLVPEEVEKQTRKQVMPTWMYLLGGNAMWRSSAKANGVADQLRATPYERR